MEYRSIDDDHHWRYIYNPVLNKWKEKLLVQVMVLKDILMMN